MTSINAIWVGDHSKCPMESLKSWGEVKLWGNDALNKFSWELNTQMKHYFLTGELNGVADCMRWELLYEFGGTFIDADSVQVQPIPEWFNELEAIATWEQEFERPGLIACGFLSFKPKDLFVRQIIETIKQTPLDNKLAWETVGPMAITRAFYSYKPRHLTILPSHFFYPQHHTGASYTGKYVIARQSWSSTFKNY